MQQWPIAKFNMKPNGNDGCATGEPFSVVQVRRLRATRVAKTRWWLSQIAHARGERDDARDLES